MFFTSGIIIVFFCFSFYLIWNQFLRKETRLSSSLHVLRKKITDLENLSITVDAQIDRQIPVVNEKIHKIEALLKIAQKTCKELEQQLAVHQQSKEENKPAPPPPSTDLNMIDSVKTSQEEKVAKFKNNTNKESQFIKPLDTFRKKESRFEFGDSPFKNIDFSDSP